MEQEIEQQIITLKAKVYDALFAQGRLQAQANAIEQTKMADIKAIEALELRQAEQAAG